MINGHRRERMPFWPALLAVATIMGTVYMAVAWLSVGRWWAVLVAAVVAAEAAVVAAAAHVVGARAQDRIRARAERWAQPLIPAPFVVPDHSITDTVPESRDF